MTKVLFFLNILFLYSSLLYSKEIFDLDHNDLVVGDIRYIKSEQGESIPGLTIRYDTGYHELLSAKPNNKKWFPITVSYLLKKYRIWKRDTAKQITREKVATMLNVKLIDPAIYHHPLMHL